ncbi:MAG: c-type cytochrome [Oscillochloridaceae bacterium umkhey_bin13]
MDYVGLAILITLALLFTFLAYRAFTARRIWLRLLGGLPAALLAFAFSAAFGLALVGYNKLNAVYPNPPSPLTLQSTPQLVAEGERFGRSCVGCHSSNGQLPMNGQDFLGAAGDGPPVGTLWAPNLTPAHLGTWSDGEIIRAIREGVGRNGRSLIIMPSAAFRNMSDEDVLALLAYLRAQPAVGEPSPPRQLNVIGAILIATLFPPDAFSAQQPITAPVVAPPRGPTALLDQLNTLWFSLVIIPTLAGVGALIVARRPANRIGLLLLIPALMLALITLTQPYLAQFTPDPPEATPLLLFLVWLNGWGWIWLIFPLLLIIQLFPNGRPLSPRWRTVAYATIGWAGLFVVAWTFSRVYNTIEPPLVELVNPYGMFELQQLELLIGVVWFPGLLLLTGLSLIVLGLRFRCADPVERDQIKWLLSAWVLFASVYIVGGLLGVGGEASLGGQIFSFFFNLTVLAIPLAIGVAILRHRLYDIDIIIRRTLVYTALTLTLGATYLLSIVTLQALFVQLTGQESTLAVVASTLAIAALFQPLRTRVQRVIDRRFFRKRYDAHQVLAAFAQRAQHEADLDALAADVIVTIQETLEPAGATLWLVRR